MDSKGLDVCNSLDLDKVCWRCCCQDGRKAACCHDCLDSLTVGFRALRAPAHFIATKQGEAAQTGPAELGIFGCLCNHFEWTILL